MLSTLMRPHFLKRILFPEAPGGYQIFMEYARVIGVALLIALLFRTFVASPYKIPSSSMMPTLLVGDYLFVSKYTYGVPIPLSGGERVAQELPQRGDVVVFKKSLPTGGEQNYIKRVMAVPGDEIAFRNQVVWLNGEPLATNFKGSFQYFYKEDDITAKIRTEQTENRRYYSLIQNATGPKLDEVTVPEGHFVMMGDNRDSSYDSRFWQHPKWGFVPMEDIVGRAEFIFWSWNRDFMPRFSRIGTSLRAQEKVLPLKEVIAYHD